MVTKKSDDNNRESNAADQSDTATESRSSRRRKLIKSIATSGGVAATGLTAGTWIKPVVHTISLPAHAAMSMQRAVVQVTLDLGSVMDYFINTAHAIEFPPCAIPDTFCVDKSGGTIVITIDGESSDPVSFMNNVVIPGPITIVAGAKTYNLTNITVNQATIMGTIMCSQSEKDDNTSGFNGPFVEGTCATVVF